jgi:hypothetical protein
MQSNGYQLVIRRLSAPYPALSRAYLAAIIKTTISGVKSLSRIGAENSQVASMKTLAEITVAQKALSKTT